MSEFLRPEARAFLWRWREALGGVALLILGLWMVAGPGFLLAIPGAAFAIAGAFGIWLGIQRARFRGTGGGTGAVQVDEGQITYYGPLTGGSVALREMVRLSLDRQLFPAHWRLEQRGQQPLLIPLDAQGADALFDAFATLPGLQTERMLQEMQGSQNQAVVIWQKTSAKPQGVTVH